MAGQYTITFEGDHVQIVSDGDKSLAFAEQLWTTAVAACKKHNCYKILGIAHTTQPMGTLDAYHHGELFRKLGISHDFRMAWVEMNPDARDVVKFIETVLSNRGLPGRVFENVDDAKRWLLEES